MGLLDRLGTGMSGPMPYDPAMLQGLGLDPEAMQRERSRMAMLQFLAGLGGAKAKGGASFGQALNEGLSAALQYRAGQQGQETNQLYMLQNMKRTQAADEAARAESARDAELAAQLNSDEFWQQAPPELAQYRPILSKLPPRQAAQLLAQTQQQIGADKRQQALFGQQAAMQEDRQAAQEALAAQRQAAMMAAIGARGGGEGRPGEFERLLETLSPEDRQKAINRKLGLEGGPNDRAPASVLARTARDAEAQLDVELGLTNMLSNFDEAESLLKGTGGRKAATGAIDPFGFIGQGAKPQAMLSTEQQRLNALVKSQVVETAKNFKGNFSDRDALLNEAASFNLNNSPEANQAILARMRAIAQRGITNARARLDHYDAGGTVLDFGSGLGANAKPPGGQGGGGGAPASQGRDHYPYPLPHGGEQPPEQGPPGAVRGPDGSWIDPKTGRKYEWVP